MKETHDFINNPQLELLNIGHAELDAGWNFRDVSSPFARIFLVTGGCATIRIEDGETHELFPGHMCLIPPFCRHSYECTSTITLYYIHQYEIVSGGAPCLADYIYPVRVEATGLDATLVAQLLETNRNRELPRYDPHHYDTMTNVISCIRANRQKDAAQRLMTHGTLQILMSRFMIHASERHVTSDDRIRSVLKYIRRNIDRDISTLDLASFCCLSQEYFIRLFKREIGLTPMQYIHRKKMEKAQLLLATENKSIEEVAYSLAFQNTGYFNRLFKKHTGHTPGGYKKGNGVQQQGN